MLFLGLTLTRPLLALGNVDKSFADLFVLISHISNLPKGKKDYSLYKKSHKKGVAAATPIEFKFKLVLSLLGIIYLFATKTTSTN